MNPLEPVDDRNSLIPAVTQPKRLDLIKQQAEPQQSSSDGYGGFFGGDTAPDERGEMYGGFFDAPTVKPTAAKPAKEKGDFARGFGDAYKQIPQLARGVQAIAGATAEKIVGEGGIATAIKKSGVEGFQKAGEEIAKTAKPSDSWNHSYEQAKQGDFGSLVDWLQHGLGYVGGQATQMLATAGVGSLVGKAAVGTAAKKVAEGMVAKEAAKITATATGAKLGKDEVMALATKAVTDKFSKIGTNAALAGAAVGMEGGEIGGDLASKAQQEGRQLTGAELGKAFASTLAAGGLEFVGDKLGLDILLGKSPLLKPAGAMQGAGGRVARAGVAAAGAAPIEAGTEFGQTLIEEYGKGNDPLSAESMHQAKDAAALGALGGGTIGTVGGLFSSPQEAQIIADQQSKATGIPHEVQPNPEKPDTFIVVPKTRSAQGVPLQQDQSGNLSPEQPTPADFSQFEGAPAKPGFLQSAEERMRQEASARQAEANYAANPVTPVEGYRPKQTPGTPPMPEPVPQPDRKTRISEGVPLNRDASGALVPETDNRQSVGNIFSEAQIKEIESKPGFLRTPEEKLLLAKRDKEQADRYANNPIVTIAGKPVTELSNQVLIYTANRGGEKAKKIAAAEIKRRETEGVDPAIANAPESTPDAVARIIATGQDKAQDKRDEKPLSTPSEKPVKAATVKIKPVAPVKTKEKKPASPKTYEQAKIAADDAWERNKKAGAALDKFPKGKMGLTPDEIKNTPEWKAAKKESDDSYEASRKANSFLLKNFPKETKADREAARNAKTEALAKKPENKSILSVPENETDDIRPLVESLIKRRSAAKQINKERSFDKALDAAKKMLAGEPVKPAHLRSAAALLRNDQTTHDLVMQLHDKALAAHKAGLKAAKQPKPEPKPEDSPTFKPGDTVKIHGDKNDKIHTIESIGKDGFVYLRSGGGNDAKHFYHAKEKQEASHWGDLISDNPGPNHSENVARWKKEGEEKVAKERRKGQISLPDGTALPTEWDVVDADSVTASLKEGVNQPRDRSRAASDIQVQGIANKPDYKRLSDSPVMDVGAPTLSQDGAIVGGNGRFEGVSRAYDQGTHGEYLKSLKADAAAKGIDPAKIDGMKKPVLVRRITQEFDTRKLAVASNSGTSLQYSGLELAKIDAGRMKGLENLDITDSGDIALTGSNIQATRLALGDYTAAELGAFTDKDGMLSQEGMRRIRNAILYQAYGNSPTLSRIVESTDNDLRNISGALVKAAGTVARVRADIQSGALPAELDISEELVGAVEALSKIRTQGGTVDEFLAQIGMFGEEINEQSKFILKVLEENIRSQKKIAEFIRTYYDWVSRLDTSSDDIFGANIPTKTELLKHAKERITDKAPVIKDLFSRSKSNRKPVEKSTGQSKDNGRATDSRAKDQVTAVVNDIKGKWKNAPEIVVLDSMADAPLSARAENLRQLSQGATGHPEGFISGGKVYLVADQLHTPEDVTRVLLHETLGHYGLQGTFGQGLTKILKQVSALRQKDVNAKAAQYGLDMSKESDRLIAAEEVLSELAQTNPQNSLVQRALATIRTWLRENIPGFEKLKLSDAEIIEGILNPARRFVEQAQTQSPAFRKWFGNSKVVDENGKPLRVYHGTAENFSAFDKAKRGGILRSYFSDDPQISAEYGSGREGSNIMPVYLALKNPLIVDAKGGHWSSFDLKTLPPEVAAAIPEKNILRGAADAAFVANSTIANAAESLGYDGFISKNVIDDGGTYGYKTPSDVFITFKAEQIKSAIGNNGNFDSSNPDIRFSRSGSATKTPMRERVEKITDSIIYNFQDRFKPLKDIQERAGPVAEDQDAALAEERYSGMVRARTDRFQEEQRDPLLKAIHDSGVAYEDVEQFLHALHAPSRNKAMQEINPTQDELTARVDSLTAKRDTLAKDPDVTDYLKARRELRQAEADIDDGIADESLATMLKREIAQLKRMPNVREYTNAVDNLKALRLVKPFDGDNTALSGMSNAESQAILDKADADGTRNALDKVSSIVDDITAATRQAYVDAGLEKSDAIEAWNNKYEHYVPLHRDEVSGTTMPRIGQGYNIRGKESKRATGSNKEVTNILAHIVAQHEAAIIRAEKSRVDQALFKFASIHPDPSVWTLDDAPMISTVDDTSGLVVKRVDPTYKNRDEVLTLKINGEEHTITFNTQNPEAMRLAASMKNLSADQLGEVTQLVGKFTRFLATMNTTANPVFTARNFLRDLQTAYVNLTDTALAGKKREVFRDVPDAIKGMWNMERGKHGSQWAKYAAEFKAAGGQTGWMEFYRDIGERADTLKKELESMKPGKRNLAWNTAKSWWDMIQNANNAVENGTRLSAYVHARNAGLSEGKAAQLAKNLTVNFNTRGAKSVQLNAWYMFMNASIQGTARLVKALSHKQVQKIVGGIITSGFLMDTLARSMAGDDDDDGENDYDQLPEHTKAMNFIFMVDGRPITIPMPYGYNFFASVGRKMSEIMGRENYSAVKSATDLTSVFLDAFSPTGAAGSLLQYAAPTVADPFVQWAENKSFAGTPLRRSQNPFGVPNPEYQMGFKSTSAPAKWLAETLNNESGGNEVRPGYVNVNPAFFDFAVSSFLGGAGRTTLQAVSAPMKAASGQELQAREIPFLNIFASAKPEYQTERKYFDAVREVERTKEELKTYREKGDLEMVAQIRQEHASDLRMQGAALATKAILTRLRKQDIALDKADPEDKQELRKEIEEKKRAAMAKFNKQYFEAINAEN